MDSKWTKRNRKVKEKNTRKRDLKMEMKATGFKYNWKKLETAGKDRARLRRVVCG